MSTVLTESTKVAPQDDLSRRRERLEEARRDFLKSANDRSPSRGEVIEEANGYARITIIRGRSADR